MWHETLTYKEAWCHTVSYRVIRVIACHTMSYCVIPCHAGSYLHDKDLSASYQQWFTPVWHQQSKSLITDTCVSLSVCPCHQFCQTSCPTWQCHATWLTHHVTMWHPGIEVVECRESHDSLECHMIDRNSETSRLEIHTCVAVFTARIWTFKLLLLQCG